MSFVIEDLLNERDASKRKEKMNEFMQNQFPTFERTIEKQTLESKLELEMKILRESGFGFLSEYIQNGHKKLYSQLEKEEKEEIEVEKIETSTITSLEDMLDKFLENSDESFSSPIIQQPTQEKELQEESLKRKRNEEDELVVEEKRNEKEMIGINLQSIKPIMMESKTFEKQKKQKTSSSSSTTTTSDQLNLDQVIESLKPRVRFSRLSPDEHSFYFDLEAKLNGPHPLIGQLNLFEKLKLIVENEQFEFRLFQKQQLLESDEKSKTYLTLNELVSNRARELLNERFSKAISNLPKVYKFNSEIKLTSIDDGLSSPPPTTTTTASNVSFKFKQDIVDCGRCLKIVLPSTKESFKLDLSENWKHQSCNSVSLYDDPVVQQIIQEHQVQFVVSSSTLASLIQCRERSNSFGTTEMNLPVRIERNELKRIIFIEKKLANPTMTTRQMNEFFFNSFLKSKYNVVANNESHFEGIDLQSKSMERNANSLSNSMKDSVEKLGLSGAKTNYAYKLWSLGNFTLLVRFRMNGVFMEPDQHARYRFMQMRTKVEFGQQSEMITVAEQLKWWISAILRPSLSWTLLFRVDVTSNTIVDWTTKESQQLRSGSQSNLAISTMFNIFQQLYQIPSGRYLMHQSIGQKNISLYSSFVEDSVLGIFDSTAKISLNEWNFSIEKDPSRHFIPIEWKKKRLSTSGGGGGHQIPDTFPLNQNLKRHLKETNGLFCWEFSRGGGCRFGNNCPYPHILKGDSFSSKKKKTTRQNKRLRAQKKLKNQQTIEN